MCAYYNYYNIWHIQLYQTKDDSEHSHIDKDINIETDTSCDGCDSTYAISPILYLNPIFPSRATKFLQGKVSDFSWNGSPENN